MLCEWPILYWNVYRHWLSFCIQASPDASAVHSRSDMPIVRVPMHGGIMHERPMKLWRPFCYMTYPNRNYFSDNSLGMWVTYADCIAWTQVYYYMCPRWNIYIFCCLAACQHIYGNMSYRTKTQCGCVLTSDPLQDGRALIKGCACGNIYIFNN
jgi:hypothetical protein